MTPDRATGSPADNRLTPWQLVVVVVLLCALAASVGWWVGRPDDESFNPVDTGFLSDMTLHHQGAIQLGFDYLANENDSSVGHFAREIVTAQSQEVAIMNGLLDDAGNPPNAYDDVSMDWMGESTDPASMPGLATEAEFAALRDARGTEADDLFTALMIRHHAAGVDMAEHAVANGKNGRVKQLAARMAAAQRSEMQEMNVRRIQLGLARVDASSGHGSNH